MQELIVKTQNWMADVKERAADDRGATAVEYGLMVALIAVAIIITVTALGGKLNTLFTSITNAL